MFGIDSHLVCASFAAEVRTIDPEMDQAKQQNKVMDNEAI